MTDSKKAEELLREWQFVRISILVYIPIGCLLTIGLIVLLRQVPPEHWIFRNVGFLSALLAWPISVWLLWFVWNSLKPGLFSSGYILGSGYILSAASLFIWAMLIADPPHRVGADEWRVVGALQESAVTSGIKMIVARDNNGQDRLVFSGRNCGGKAGGKIRVAKAILNVGPDWTPGKGEQVVFFALCAP